MAWHTRHGGDWPGMSWHGRLRLLICGDRYWTDERLIFWKLDDILAWAPRMAVIEGCCTGADAIAEKWTTERVKEGHDIEGWHFPADWSIGKRAGPIRNKKMLVEGKPHMVLAFHPNLHHSQGTVDMVNKARAAGVSTTVIGGEKW